MAEKRATDHLFAYQAILQDLSAVARLHQYSPTQDEQLALSSTLGALAASCSTPAQLYHSPQSAGKLP